MREFPRNAVMERKILTAEKYIHCFCNPNMGQRNGEWYSVHTNGVALREMAQRNVEWFREMAPRNVAWYSVHTSLQNIRCSS